MERIDLFKFNASLRVNIVEKISDNLYIAKMYDYAVLINKSGEILSVYDYDDKFFWDMETTKFDSPYKYDFAFKFCNERSLVVKNGMYGYIDNLGEEIIGLKFCYAESFSEGLAFVNDGEYQCYIDIDGNILFQTGDIRTEPFKNGVSIITNVDDQYGIMDKTGGVLFVNDTLQIKSFSEELAPSQSATNKKWGYINKAGKYEISPNYEEADLFSEGLAAVQLFGKWGYIDKKQNPIYAPQFDYADPFVNGKARVGKNGKYYNIYNKNNSIVYLNSKNNQNTYNRKRFKVIKYMDNLNNTNYLSNIRLTGYYTCFVLDDKAVVIEDRDYETYLKKVHEIEELLRREQMSKLYQDLAVKSIKKKRKI